MFEQTLLKYFTSIITYLLARKCIKLKEFLHFDFQRPLKISFHFTFQTPIPNKNRIKGLKKVDVSFSEQY
jgi:hypothetical protein